MNEYEKLREQLESLYNNLFCLQENPEKNASKIAYLMEALTEIRHRMSLYKIERMSEMISRRGR